jgi:alpha-L-rhamnosidase
MQKFIIKPNLVGDLTYANAASGSLYGRIVSSWSRSGKNAAFDIEIPPNTSARVYIPARDVKDVMEGGKPAADVPGVKFIEKDGANSVFQVGSGVYRFTSILE